MSPGDRIGREIQSRIYRAGVFGRTPRVPIQLDRLEKAARRAMSRTGWAYLAGSAGTEQSAAANRRAFDRWQLVPRMLTGAADRDLSVELFGHRYASPLLLSPIGVLDAAAPGGDLAVARAAATAAVPMVISTQASASTEQITAEMREGPRWYQLYWSSVPDLAVSMIGRAERAGCRALVVTLDTHMLGWRPRDLDLGFLPFARGLGIAQYTSDPVFLDLVRTRAAAAAPRASERPTPSAVRSLWSMARNYPGDTRENLRSPAPRAAVETFLDVFPNPALTWSDLAFLREHTRLPIVLKGILADDDARRAVDAGVDAVMVSNHGGRQVDRAIGALDALPGVVEAVDGRMPVLFDSGVRTGADVLVALALGATAVGIGRPYVYGLAIDGEDGVRAIIDHLLAELDLTMGLCGVASVSELGRHLLTTAG